jgi:DeoR family transcriptional regulator, fructose operon transcriptional repressor
MNSEFDPGSGTRLQFDRQRQIYRIARQLGAVDVSDLAQRFEVTTETIRRDLSDLQEQKLVRRVHGGAVPVERTFHEPMVDARAGHNTEEKLAIGRLAAEELRPNATVIIDSGSTGQLFAEVLPTNLDLKIATNSLITAITLARRGVAEITMLGGGVRTNTFAAVDTMTVESVRNMRVDLLFIGCDGLSFARGLTTPYTAEYHVKRAMIQSARRVIALVDQSKFHNDQTYSFAAFNELDVLITDSRVSDEDAELLADSEVVVRRA